MATNEELPKPDFEQDNYCEECGSDMEWVECYECGGNGGRTYEDDLQFEDPLWYQPGDYEVCDLCENKGGWNVCINVM